jgi:ABC-type Fe3+ transport system permease subunit
MRIDDLVARKRKVHRIGESLKQLLVAVTFCLVFGYPLRFFVRSFALTVKRILAVSMIARPVCIHPQHHTVNDAGRLFLAETTLQGAR